MPDTTDPTCIPYVLRACVERNGTRYSVALVHAGPHWTADTRILLLEWAENSRRLRGIIFQRADLNRPDPWWGKVARDLGALAGDGPGIRAAAALAWSCVLEGHRP